MTDSIDARRRDTLIVFKVTLVAIVSRLTAALIASH